MAEPLSVDTSSEVAVAALGLTKHFGDLHALDDLTLQVHAGEVMGLLGPNGAGKSTTIRLLLDVLRPTRGSASILGRPVSDHRLRSRVGYVPADLHLDDRLTGRRYLDYLNGVRGRRPGHDADAAAALIERFDLHPDRPIHELSSGNRRKVAIVAAFMHRPDVYILDEPTSGLDPLLQAEFHRLLDEERNRGAAILLSSHILHDVEQVADRVAVLRQGRLVATERVEELHGRARRLVHLECTGGDPRVFDGLPEVVERTGTDREVHLVVVGSMDPIIKAAATLDVERLVAPEPDLEEAFFDLYQGTDLDQGTGP